MKSEAKKSESQKMALDVHLSQFEAVRNDVTQATGLQNNLVNYSIAIIGGTVALFALKGDNGDLLFTQFPAIFSIVSILLAFMTWASLEAEIRIHDSLSYIHNNLGKKVQKLIGEDLGNEYLVLRMEIAEASRSNRARAIIRAMLVSAKFMISFVPSVALLMIQFYSSKTFFVGWLNISLVVINLFVIIVVPIVLISQAYFVSSYYWKK